MNLTTYEGLQSAIADTLARTDLANVIPGWIALAETQMRRTVRHWKQEKRVTADVAGRFYCLPPDYLETVRLHRPDGARMVLATHAEIQDRRAQSLVAGAPLIYAHVGGDLEFYPVPDGTYALELVYYADFPSLSNTVQSNWLLTLAPDAYLYGALVHSAPYLSEDVRLETFAALFNAAVEGVNRDNSRAQLSGTGLRKRFQNVG
jgi:hypothetical protein